MNVYSRISILVATGILISSALGLGTSCVWDPYNSETITVGSPLTVNASPGDPAPDDQGQCACDSNDNPVDWAPTGNWSVSYGGDAGSSGVVDTSIGDEWTVEANIQFEYSCPETGQTKMVDDPHGAWTKQYTAQSYVIDGPSSLDHDTSGSYTAQSADGSPVNVTSWDAGDGVVTGSGSTVDISWSVPGQKSVTANVQNVGTVTRSVEVLGTIEASISTPSDPAIVSVGEAVTFEAADPTGGDGNYTYEWSFENGQAPAGTTHQKKVEGVKFQAEALGKENAAKVIVRDGSGNSGVATIKAVVPKLSANSVSFSGSGNHRLLDITDAFANTSGNAISSPEWTTNSQKPICYVQGSSPSVAATFGIQPSLSGSRSVLIKATGNQGATSLTYQEQSVDLTGSEATLSSITSSDTLDGKVFNGSYSMSWSHKCPVISSTTAVG